MHLDKRLLANFLHSVLLPGWEHPNCITEKSGKIRPRSYKFRPFFRKNPRTKRKSNDFNVTSKLKII